MHAGIVLVGGDWASGYGAVAPWPSYVALGIAALSLVATVVVGFANRSTARQALALSERQEARRNLTIDVYVNDSRSWRAENQDGRFIGIHVTAANPGDNPNSIVAAELHLTYELSGQVMTLKVRHTGESSSLPGRIAPISLPARLGANAALNGWLVFELAEVLTARLAIDRYDLVVRDVHGIEESVQVTIFPELSGEQAP
jgi:hypothetical protein